MSQRNNERNQQNNERNQQNYINNLKRYSNSSTENAMKKIYNSNGKIIENLKKEIKKLIDQKEKLQSQINQYHLQLEELKPKKYKNNLSNNEDYEFFRGSQGGPNYNSNNDVMPPSPYFQKITINNFKNANNQTKSDARELLNMIEKTNIEIKIITTEHENLLNLLRKFKYAFEIIKNRYRQPKHEPIKPVRSSGIEPISKIKTPIKREKINEKEKPKKRKNNKEEKQ
jgi:hypothetical protein